MFYIYMLKYIFFVKMQAMLGGECRAFGDWRFGGPCPTTYTVLC
uniref:Uncharacterized protein n=1 Tax=Anguilla anguilla TaxID=7936 RepID=A0A0E9T4Z4_ANGAN